MSSNCGISSNVGSLNVATLSLLLCLRFSVSNVHIFTDLLERLTGDAAVSLNW